MPAPVVPDNPASTAPPGPQRWAILTTYPPTACGIATFSRSLARALATPDLRVDVVRLVDDLQPPVAGVAHQWVRGEAGAIARVTAALNTYDLVVVQHEFGIFPGVDGGELLAVLDGLDVPLLTVAHTVRTTPTGHQKRVLGRVLAASDAVVTMTRTAASRLADAYGGALADVHVIPHGVADELVDDAAEATTVIDVDTLEHVTTPPGPPPAPASAETRPVVLTWGLLGVGKGIEWGLDAMAQLTDLDPRPLYVVAGCTHPRVLAHEGERYRTMLARRAARLGIADDVRFLDEYLDDARLHRLIRSAAVVLLPYDSLEQVTSGVLSEAVAAGRPVVSTLFPHAVEALADGVGVLVPQRDAAAIAAALRGVLTDGDAATSLRARATAAGPELTWTRVADRYRRLGREVVSRHADRRAAHPASPAHRRDAGGVAVVSA